MKFLRPFLFSMLLLIPTTIFAAYPFHWINVVNNCGDGTFVAYSIDGMIGRLQDGNSQKFFNRGLHVRLDFDNGQGQNPHFIVLSDRSIFFSIDRNSGAVRADW